MPAVPVHNPLALKPLMAAVPRNLQHLHACAWLFRQDNCALLMQAGQDDMEAAEDPMQIIARDAAPNVTGPLAEPERSSAFSRWQPAAEQPAIAAAGHVPSEEGTSLVAYNGSAGTLVPQEVPSSCREGATHSGIVCAMHRS